MTARRTARNGAARWRAAPRIHAKHLVRLPSMAGRIIRTVKIIFVCFRKPQGETDKWKAIYKRRSSIERSNKREKIDYHLESVNHRSTMMWYVRILGTMMCQHIDAWYAHREKELEFLKDQMFA